MFNVYQQNVSRVHPKFIVCTDLFACVVKKKTNKNEKNKEIQHSTWKENGELIALRDARRQILEFHQQNLDELLKNELNHDEPPWRTPVTKGWRDKMKDERIRLSLAMI